MKLINIINEIASDLISEKKLCPKGRAYYDRRRAAGEVPSAYLSGRAVKVCKGLMEDNQEVVKCKKCDWKWSIEDGGKDPYTCHKCGHDNTETYRSLHENELTEDLYNWFKKEDWVRIDTAGNITGPCGTMKKGKATTRCLPRAKANSLSKEERASTSRKKASADKKGKRVVPNTKKAKVRLKEYMNLSEEEVSPENQREMVTGIAEIVRGVKDINNRKELAKKQIKQLKAEGIKFDVKEFLSLCGFKNKEEEIDEYDVETIQEFQDFKQFIREYAKQLSESQLIEAEYRGRKVKLGKPMQGDVKKFKVYVKNPAGKVIKVNFGQKGMVIKKNNPKRRKSFRARMNCDNPGPRTKANYWSCRKW